MYRSDEEILKDIENNNTATQAFKELIDKYKVKLYWHIRKIVISHSDTDDILQNVFIKVWKNIYTFKRQSSLYTWLYRIATNESLNFLKNKKNKFFIPLDLNKMLIEKLETDPYFNGSDADKELQKAILLLPEKQRLVFNMRYFDEMSYEEMSEILNTSVGALKASYHHAVKKIEKYLNIKLNIYE
ncbi:MAG: RNA polymerase sigma factor [Bacteroidales bacterium]|nr:RNA polymerase sigma factor [Bacteroidales bacterium]